MNPLFLTDGYKTGHTEQYPEGTTMVYSNWTPRSNKHAPKGCDKVVNFGAQYVFTWLHELFSNDFFFKDKDLVCGEIKEELSLYLNTDYDVSHFEALHDLGYLPILVKSLPEGIEVPMRIPTLTVKNTLPEFYWLTNFLETIISTMLWQPMTSATIALRYKRILKEWATKTDEKNIEAINFQGHDFSMRGMSSIGSVIASGMGHSIIFSGSDSLPVIPALRKYYHAEGFTVGSVNATEHSVMCAGSKDDEIGTFRRLIKTYPTGILSIVSDTWDLWKVLTEYLPILKEEIEARDGKIVIRPDSGDPVDIICGSDWENFAGNEKGMPSDKGVIELLWDIFGGTTNDQGFKVLNDKIGAIYGDSITPQRATDICSRLASKGFASTNIVFGIGSFTYQFNTRDTFGFAMKATACEVKGEFREIFKDPITGDGIKKSAKGYIRVIEKEGELIMEDQVSVELENTGLLTQIYQNGYLNHDENLEEIRGRINNIL